MVASSNNQTDRGVTLESIEQQRAATVAARAAFAAFWAQRGLFFTSSARECERATAFLPTAVNGSSHHFWNMRGAQ